MIEAHGNRIVQIRPLAAHDLLAASELASGHGFSGFSPSAMQEAFRRSSCLMLVAVDDRESTEASALFGELVGFAAFELVPPEAELHLIVVGSRARGRGIGHRLIQEGEAAMLRRGVASIFLEVAATGNPVANAFYDRLGYFEVGRRRAYYSDGDDALIRCRRLLD